MDYLKLGRVGSEIRLAAQYFMLTITMCKPSGKDSYFGKRILSLKGPITTVEGGWSGGAKVLGKLSVPGRPTIWIIVGQGPTALAVSAGGGCLDIFTLIYPFFPLSPSLWETAQYRLKYCLKRPLNPKPTNHNCRRRHS